MTDSYGPFVAGIFAFDSSHTPLGPTLFEAGTSNGNADGTAIYIGIQDLHFSRTFPRLSSASLVAHLTATTLPSTGCASHPARHLSPAASSCFGFGVLGLGGVLRRRLLG